MPGTEIAMGLYILLTFSNLLYRKEGVYSAKQSRWGCSPNRKRTFCARENEFGKLHFRLKTKVISFKVIVRPKQKCMLAAKVISFKVIVRPGEICLIMRPGYMTYDVYLKYSKDLENISHQLSLIDTRSSIAQFQFCFYFSVNFV